MSKGSKTRPTDRKKFEAGYDRIFGEKKFNIKSSGRKETIGESGTHLGHGYNPYCYAKRPVFVPAEVEQENYRRVFGTKDEQDG